MKSNRILLGFMIYGIVVSFISVWWWYYADSIFPLNIPGVILGDTVYQQAINHLGNPHSEQAHFTIPWLLRIPQVYVPLSILFWGLLGLVIQLIYKKVLTGRHNITTFISR